MRTDRRTKTSQILTVSAGTLTFLFLVTVLGAQEGHGAGRDWPAYGGDPEGTRYSPLTQIDRSNVGRLQVAWQFDPSEGPPNGRFQAQPIVVNGILYSVTPGSSVVALDGATGKLKWSWNSRGRTAVRGLTYWTDGKEQRLLAAFGRYVYAVDAVSGKPFPDFGRGGRIDLHYDLDRDPKQQSVSLTTPGVIYKDLYIVGGRTSEVLPASFGDIRAYNVRTGRLHWTFHTIPRPGEYGYETWPKKAWTYTGAANNWAGMAVDVKRGLVYVPTGSASADFYGANRVGDDLFANTLLALDAATGKRIWHFQGVKHDIWDRDFPSPPTLVTVKRDGKSVDAVAQTTKHGFVFLFDRANGTPLFPIEYRHVPPSTVEGEVAAQTQPFPLKPAPYARQLLTEDMLTTRTPQAHQWALEQFKTFRNEGLFVPLMVGKETVIFPGFDGGAEWGGSAVDPNTGVLYVNANDLAWTSSMRRTVPAANLGPQTYLNRCAACHAENMSGGSVAPSLVGIATRRTRAQVAEIIRNGSGRMPGSSSLSPRALAQLVQYVMSGVAKKATSSAPSPTDMKYNFTGYHRWYDPDGYPAVAPPWGTLNAIDLNSGEYAWKIPLGEYPELAEQGLKDTGTENYGGPIVTAGGLVFIGATNFDKKFRAFDKDTGKLLWETVMVNSGNATPITYEVNGKQFVVIAAFGGYGGARAG
ncbi:MAG TPA: PQQ-binding-like beta-propeller repeat protein, partial [Gemmatimonadaceae bacterium]|nr:PQQ-binding-like beta-propeller repeat protein [Gemmatimonadaceae bacterium]